MTLKYVSLAAKNILATEELKISLFGISKFFFLGSESHFKKSEI